LILVSGGKCKAIFGFREYVQEELCGLNIFCSAIVPFEKNISRLQDLKVNFLRFSAISYRRKPNC